MLSAAENYYFGLVKQPYKVKISIPTEGLTATEYYIKDLTVKQMLDQLFKLHPSIKYVVTAGS